MSWSKHHRSSGRSKSRRSYHHGNLREALIEAALDLIADKGPAGFTFAEAARAAGVSPAAPYRHFADRDALMADVARRGFERLETVLSEAWDDGRPKPMTAFQNLGRAYLAFANDEPAYYAAMFETGLPPDLDPELAQAGDRAFAVMRDACETIVAGMPAAQRPPALMVSLHIWALAHGIASLFARGDAARRPLPMPPEDLLEAGVLVYLEGLGLRDDGDSAKNR
jgi:AcrR family transcriptional regulator